MNFCILYNSVRRGGLLQPVVRFIQNVQCFSTSVPGLSSPVLNTVHYERLQSCAASVNPWFNGCKVSPISKCGYVSRKNYPFCELSEADLEENFVRGSGPGGQSVNQTANCVVLKHRPSGIVVKCHETRSLEKNRQRARERLQEQVDFHLHGSNSFLALQKRESSLQKEEKKKKNRLRLELKKAFKEREGLD